MNNKLILLKRKNNKSLEYLEELKKICIKNGKINLNALCQVWQQVPNKVKMDILPIIIKEFSINKDEGVENTVEDINLVGNLWMYTPKKIQETTIEKAIASLIVERENNEKIIQLENLQTLLYATKDKRVIRKNIGKILKVLNDSKITNIEEAYKELYNELPLTTDYNLLNIFRINKRKNPIKLDKKGIKLLENKLKKNVPIILEVSNVGELSDTDIQKYLDKGLDIEYIRLIGNGYEAEYGRNIERLPYRIETYRKCRQKIDEIIKRVGYTANQKELFVKIVKEISSIHYLHECEEMSEKENWALNDIGNMYAYRNIFNPCSNLEGLITGKAICGGYAEIINNIMSCCGIESITVQGDQTLGIKHVWNQVKLDGVWYNADITYDAENIEDKKMAYWLLRSDKDFLTDIDGKSFYMGHIPSKKQNIHRCSQSVPYEEVNMYLNGTGGSTPSIDNNISNKIIYRENDELEK